MFECLLEVNVLFRKVYTVVDTGVLYSIVFFRMIRKLRFRSLMYFLKKVFITAAGEFIFSVGEIVVFFFIIRVNCMVVGKVCFF